MAAPIPIIEKLTARVIRVLGCNPGSFTLQGTNSYIVGSGKRRILIDTSNESQKPYLDNLRKVLIGYHNINIQEIILTHWHADHVGAVKEVCKDVLKESDVKVSKMKRVIGTDVELGPEARYTFLNGTETISTEGATLRVIPSPGHSDDHIALLLEEENSLFSGDCILGEGTTVFEDLYDYMQSLHRLAQLKPATIYPGHGPLIRDGVERIDSYIKHRNMREKQIVETLQCGEWMTAMDMVLKIYTDVSPKLYVAAMGNVLQHLSKLFKEGKVEMDKPADEVIAALRRSSSEGSKRAPEDLDLLMRVKWRETKSTTSSL